MRHFLDALRVLFRIAFRNLVASRVRTVILGLIVLVGSLLVVVGASVMDSIDRGMKTSIQGSLGGQLQVYAASSRDPLALYGGMMGESRLDAIEDFATVKQALSRVPNVKAIVPMGIDQALVSTGNSFDVALERLRADARRVVAGERDPALLAGYHKRQAHVRRMVDLLASDLAQARTIIDTEGRDAPERRRQGADVRRAATDEFWAGFDRDPYGSLEFLENRVAPMVMDSGFTFIRYVGTDVEAFMKAFELARVAEGEPIPPGQRGILLGKQYAEEWLKLRNARRLDQIKNRRDRFGRRIGSDEEMQRWVREMGGRIREIEMQLDPVEAEEVQRTLAGPLGAPADEPLPALLSRLFAVTDATFDEHYRLFYEVLAPRLRLYQISVGDVITIKAPGKSGAFNSVNVKVYGMVEYRGVEKSGIAGNNSIMDLMSFRDLYGFLTREKREEIARLREHMGAVDVARDEAEDVLFGGATRAVETAATSSIDDRKLLAGVGEKRAAAEAAADRVYTQEEIDQGVALNAAILLDDPRKARETRAAIAAASREQGLGLTVVDWQEASGLVGQFVFMLRAVLVVALLIFFAVALVIINNAMVMAALQRVKEIGTMRAIGAQKGFVTWMLLVEIGAVGLVFGLAGAAVGGVVVALMRAAGGIPATTDMLFFLFSGPALLPRLDPASVVLSLVVVISVSILSGLYPAWIALKVSPVEAMASEE
jgi:ABC-type lipoprotein release transport system permease subunit